MGLIAVPTSSKLSYAPPVERATTLQAALGLADEREGRAELLGREAGLGGLETGGDEAFSEGSSFSKETSCQLSCSKLGAEQTCALAQGAGRR